jgi:diketogulonate reductase-like aldo/keto reductase
MRAAAAGSNKTIQGVAVPTMMYGTAWKEDRTASLVIAAMEAGFRAIDTANQRRHYFEAAVGDAIRKTLEGGRVGRGDLFLQTKFTYVNGQDHRLPYDPKAPIPNQVEQSFASSLEHLGVETLDAYLLHGPSTYPGLGEADRQAWTAMEDLQRSGAVRLIGISNVTAEQLEQLHADARVKPALVQNRCFTRPEADSAVREFCEQNGIGYEGFSLLTAHRGLLEHPHITLLAERERLTAAQLVLRYCLDAGMIVLTGTTSGMHMEQDLAIQQHPLAAETRAEMQRMLG